MKIVGLVVTWNNLPFFKCALQQALDFCDEVILVEGCHTQKYPKRSTDGTCEYIETVKNRSGLKVVDFSYEGRYDVVQANICTHCPKESSFFKPDNWLFHFNDDIFYFKNDLEQIKIIMETTDYDAIGVSGRHFLFNFRFNIFQPYMGGTYAHRIIEGYKIEGISKPRYRTGRPFTVYVPKDIVSFQFTEVRKPERVKARWEMSVEKGTRASRGRFEKWMGVSWNEDKDIFKSEAVLQQIRKGKLSVYNGSHPEWLDNHPWRYINDVRRMN